MNLNENIIYFLYDFIRAHRDPSIVNWLINSNQYKTVMNKPINISFIKEEQETICLGNDRSKERWSDLVASGSPEWSVNGVSGVEHWP